MKKLIIAAAIVCAAVSSQAASVMWKSNAAKAYNGQKVYLLTSIIDHESGSYASLAAFEATAVDIGTVEASGKSYAVKERTATADSITGTGSLYLAVIDATDSNIIRYVDVSSGMNSYVYTPPDSTPGTYSGTKFADVSGSSTYATIPEPTSGLLLLLGMAGLALKRKRA